MFTFVRLKQVKIHISLLLIFTFTLGVMWQSVLVINFYSNQAEIIEKHCVNKDKPKMNCEGKCHLKKQLEKSPETTSVPSTTLKLVSFLLCGIFSNSEIVIVSFDLNEPKKSEQNAGNEKSFCAETFLPPDFCV